MNINQTLLKEVQPFLEEYEVQYEEIEHILSEENSFNTRHKGTVGIVESIMRPHGKSHLFRCMQQLGNIEYTIRPLLNNQRDHVVHALLSFLLGIYLNEYFIKKHSGERVNCFQWEIAGLLHDIGYPLEIANRAIITPFFANANQIKQEHGIKNNLGFKVNLIGLEKLSGNKISLNVIQNQLDSWELIIDTKSEYDQMINSGDINHGILGSMILLNIIDAMYEFHNPRRSYDRTEKDEIDWNQQFFESDIIPACSAIFVHALPATCFTKSKIDLIKAPLAFLLKLSDTLQEWGRPSFENPSGYSPSCFDINVNNKAIYFKAKVPDETKKKMSDEISQCLSGSFVHII
ncbi:MAG: hypothetical protein WC231_03670 [Dehalococcoidales bacterium]